MNGAVRVWAVVPAAGAGRRMGVDVPKQYLEVAGAPILAHTLSRLGTHPTIRGVVVAISAGDEYWPDVRDGLARQVTVAPGGAERADSVRNGLAALAEHADPSDWVLVHDAARPCLRADDVQKLIDTVIEGGHCGGLLALPVRDTMKRTDAAGRVQETVPRELLWHALTPQMFRLGELSAALDDAASRGLVVTDEASAMESSGYAPIVVQGHPDNLKVTHPSDLELARLYLEAQRQPDQP